MTTLDFWDSMIHLIEMHFHNNVRRNDLGDSYPIIQSMRLITGCQASLQKEEAWYMKAFSMTQIVQWGEVLKQGKPWGGIY